MSSLNFVYGVANIFLLRLDEQIMKKFGLLNGPNLDRLGKREPDIYGSQTLDEIVQNTVSLGSTLGCEVVNFQSNHEGAMIDKIHEWADSGVS